MNKEKEIWDQGYEYARGHLTVSVGICGYCGGSVERGTSSNSEVWQAGCCLECGKRPEPRLPVLDMVPNLDQKKGG